MFGVRENKVFDVKGGLCMGLLDRLLAYFCLSRMMIIAIVDGKVEQLRC